MKEREGVQDGERESMSEGEGGCAREGERESMSEGEGGCARWREGELE